MDYWKLYCSLTNPLPCVNDVITIKHLLVENVHYLGQFKRLNRHTQKVWTALLSTAASWLTFQTNLPGTAHILMLGACLPIYVCLRWIQGALRAEKAWLICVSHDNTTATIDERSCENLLQVVPGDSMPERQNNPHLNTCHKLYTVSVNEVTVPLCSMDFLQLAEKPNTTATMVGTEKGSCWSRDFLLSLRLRAKNVYSGFRNWLKKWFRVHIAFCLCFTMKQSSFVFFLLSYKNCRPSPHPHVSKKHINNERLWHREF